MADMSSLRFVRYDERESVPFITPQRSDDFSLAKSWTQAEHHRLPTQSRAELRTNGDGEWDKTSEVPAVHGASRWWALSKAVKPLFSKPSSPERARSTKPAASTPEPPSAMPAPRPVITR